MTPPDRPCEWCGREIVPPANEDEAHWADLWLTFSLLWGPRAQHDWNGYLCRQCGIFAVRVMVDPDWRRAIDGCVGLAAVHGYDLEAAYQKLVAERNTRP